MRSREYLPKKSLIFTAEDNLVKSNAGIVTISDFNSKYVERVEKEKILAVQDGLGLSSSANRQF